MLLLDPVPRLRDQLVSLLCKHSPATADELWRSVRGVQQRFTKQAVYKELGLLEESGIVVRAQGKYRITLTWLFEVIAYVEALSDRLGRRAFGGDLIPSIGRSRSWRFKSARNTDRLWVQLTSFLLQEEPGSVMYQSLPHPWHSLLYKGLDRQFDQVLRFSNATIYCVIGGDTYLDRLFMENFASINSHCANAPDFFSSTEMPHLTVINDFVITTHYTLKFTRAVDVFFERITSSRDIKSDEVITLFGNPGPITTKIEHNRKKALKIRRRFERYFGIPRST